MPSVNDSPVRFLVLGDRDDLADQTCSWCKENLSQDKAVRFEHEHAQRVFSHRIVFFPLACCERHLMHTKCAIGILDASNSISCPICKMKVEPVTAVREFLSNYSDVENACDQIHELLGWLDTGLVNRLTVFQFVSRISDLKRFVDRDSAAKNLHSMAVKGFKNACIDSLFKYIEANRSGEAIILSKGLLKSWPDDIKNDLESFWLRRCQSLVEWSKRAASDKIRYIREAREIHRCFNKNNDIKGCFEVMLSSLATSLLNHHEDYKYSCVEIKWLKIAGSNGCQRSGQLAAEILLGESKEVLANPTNIYLWSINHVLANLNYAKAFGTKKVKDELSTIWFSFFNSLSDTQFDAIRDKARHILLLPGLNKAKINKVSNWLGLVFAYGTESQKAAVLELKIKADNFAMR